VPLGDRHHHQVAAGLIMLEPHRRQHAGVGGIFQFHVDAGGFHNRRAQVEIAPLQIRGEDQPVGYMAEAAGKADAHALQFLAAAGEQNPPDACDQFVHRGLRVGGSGDDFAGRELAVGVGQGDGGLAGANIHAHDHALFIQAQEGGPAAARQTAGRTLDHPRLGDQLLHDQGNGAALQAAQARQVGPRDRMPRANEIQDDAPVDVADHLARCALNPFWVDYLHCRQWMYHRSPRRLHGQAPFAM